MISVIIPVHDNEERLTLCLAALARLALEGLIADVVVADLGARDATLEVADAAGCTILEACGELDAALEKAAGLARKDWLLGLLPGDRPDDTVAKAALRHIGLAERGGGPVAAAAFLALPAHASLTYRGAAALAFDLFGHAAPRNRRALAPKAAARLLATSGARWRGVRMRERVITGYRPGDP
jgi:hypothetical protein